ncbi:MAG: hypothetical protein LC798_11930 [Chloroflexi bacterium]|nr:hypothetical protein [Chloroflexota bacterium]
MSSWLDRLLRRPQTPPLSVEGEPGPTVEPDDQAAATQPPAAAAPAPASDRPVLAPTKPVKAALPCPQCATGHLLARVDLPLMLSVHLTRDGQVRPAEVLTTKRELLRVTRRNFTPLAGDVPLTCSACDFTSTVEAFPSLSAGDDTAAAGGDDDDGPGSA